MGPDGDLRGTLWGTGILDANDRGKARLVAITEEEVIELRSGELDLAGLAVPADRQTYVIWLLLDEGRGYPLAPITVGEDGSFNDQFPIPQSALPVVVKTHFVDIALVDNRTLASDIQAALQGQEVVLDYVGESALRGEIPRLR